ncbi:MAG: metallophosphoesterase [Luteolibacter sp.]
MYHSFIFKFPAWIAVLLISISLPAFAEKFTLVVLPDTQIAVRSKPEMTNSQMDWIVKNRTALNIPFVISVGDVVDWDTPDHAQWITASRCYETLDWAGVPYAIAVGNHDTAAVQAGGSAAPGKVKENVRDTMQFNRFFPVSRFTAQRGRQEDGKSDNAWYEFRAGGMDWLVLALELWARPEAVTWANSVVAAHPDHNVIVVTHAHLDAKGGIQPNNGGYGAQSPQAVFDQLIKQHGNMLLVLSGHVGDSAYRTDPGVKGNTIYQILQCYQNRDSGGGYLRLLDIDTVAGTINARMYSPFYDKSLEDGSTFTLENVKFVTPAAEP